MTTSADNELMDSVDLAWLEMDDPGNPMVVTGLMELEPSVKAELLVRRIVDSLMHYPRFSQIADHRRSPATWRLDPDMDWAYHVRVRSLPRSKLGLRQALAEEMAAELDRWRPLWRLTVFTRGGAGATVLFRAHHAIADGIALMHVLMRGTATAAHRKSAAATPRQPSHGRSAGLSTGWSSSTKRCRILPEWCWRTCTTRSASSSNFANGGPPWLPWGGC